MNIYEEQFNFEGINFLFFISDKIMGCETCNAMPLGSVMSDDGVFYCLDCAKASLSPADSDKLDHLFEFQKQIDIERIKYEKDFISAIKQIVNG